MVAFVIKMARHINDDDVIDIDDDDYDVKQSLNIDNVGIYLLNMNAVNSNLIIFVGVRELHSCFQRDGG